VLIRRAFIVAALHSAANDVLSTGCPSLDRGGTQRLARELEWSPGEPRPRNRGRLRKASVTHELGGDSPPSGTPVASVSRWCAAQELAVQASLYSSVLPLLKPTDPAVAGEAGAVPGLARR
jgi:hypothetical protein